MTWELTALLVVFIAALVFALVHRFGDSIQDVLRVQRRSAQRKDYLNRWRRGESGFVRCQECMEVIKYAGEGLPDHDCVNPNPPIHLRLTGTGHWEWP